MLVVLEQGCFGIRILLPVNRELQRIEGCLELIDLASFLRCLIALSLYGLERRQLSSIWGVVHLEVLSVDLTHFDIRAAARKAPPAFF